MVAKDKEAKLSMAVDIVADWLTRYVSDYRGPTASAAPKGGAAEGKSNKVKNCQGSPFFS